MPGQNLRRPDTQIGIGPDARLAVDPGGKGESLTAGNAVKAVAIQVGEQRSSVGSNAASTGSSTGRFSRMQAAQEAESE